LVDVGCLDFFLTIAAKFTIAEVIGKDENNVGRRVLLSHCAFPGKKYTKNESNDEIGWDKKLHDLVPQ
jgi:hypothetical protein